MKSYKGMAITREGAIKLIRALSEAMLNSEGDALILYDIDAPFILFDEEGATYGHQRRTSNG